MKGIRRERNHFKWKEILENKEGVQNGEMVQGERREERWKGGEGKWREKMKGSKGGKKVENIVERKQGIDKGGIGGR